MISDREAKDIFNVDEGALFFQCVPNKTLAFKNEKCSCGKISKQRVTLLFGKIIPFEEYVACDDNVAVCNKKK